MSALEIWLTIAGLTIVTFATRNFFIAFGDTLRLPDRVLHALRYAPACALVALVVPEVLMTQDALALSWSSPKIWGACAALVTILATRNMLVTMLAGMAVFSLLRLI